MPSQAYLIHLEQLLLDADELSKAHKSLSSGAAGRQFGLASLNRAIVVMSISAWESYVEELVREAIQALRPNVVIPGSAWPALNAHATQLLGRFNTPNPPHVEQLFRNCLGLPNVTSAWFWQNCSATQAAQRLTAAMTHRHEIAHGVNPRPIIHNHFSSRLPTFVRRLAHCTDVAVRSHLMGVLGLAAPWPP